MPSLPIRITAALVLLVSVIPLAAPAQIDSSGTDPLMLNETGSVAVENESSTSSLNRTERSPMVAVDASVRQWNRSALVLRYNISARRDVPNRGVVLVPDRLSVVRTEGMTTTAAGFELQNGTGTLVVRLQFSRLDQSRVLLYATSEFVAVEHPQLTVSWGQADHQRGSIGQGETGDAVILQDADADAYLTAEIVAVGDYRVATRRAANGENITVISAIRSGVGAETIATILTNASVELDVGRTAGHVYGVVGGSRDARTTLDSASGRTFGNAFVSLPDRRTILHEYVHTRQATVLGESAWLTEATAVYYAGYLQYELGYSSPARFNWWVRQRHRQHTDFTLANESLPRAYSGFYTKGAIVVAYLDSRIRRATGGNRSFEDVLRRLNERSTGRMRLSTVEFAGIVATVVGNDTLRDEIHRYVATSATPNSGAVRVDLSSGERSAPEVRETGALQRTRQPAADDGWAGSTPTTVIVALALIASLIVWVRRIRL